jgi:hypothetical protein
VYISPLISATVTILDTAVPAGASCHRSASSCSQVSVSVCVHLPPDQRHSHHPGHSSSSWSELSPLCFASQSGQCLCMCISPPRPAPQPPPSTQQFQLERAVTALLRLAVWSMSLYVYISPLISATATTLDTLFQLDR